MHMGWGPSFHECSRGFRSEGDEQDDASNRKDSNQNNPMVRFMAEG